MLHRARSDTCLSRSVYAVAYRYLYNLRGQSTLQSHARYCYSQSLASIHKALEDPLERLHDSILLAVWLIGLYEVSKHPIMCSVAFRLTLSIFMVSPKESWKSQKVGLLTSMAPLFASALTQVSV